ncbi:hypothetical protein MHU86_11762 [Fragilaria crotonensis]|nr:hypothetical protein MHU86_11762 [Fragilaria crotonensis]
MNATLRTHAPTATVLQLHRTFRWGHSNTFSHLFSPDPLLKVDYAQGLVAFGFFLTTLLLLWLLVLLLLKLLVRDPKNVIANNNDIRHRNKPIGWAAGGSVIDVQYIKKHRRDLKPHLERMVKQSWRIQSGFIMSSILIPVLIFVFLTRGLSTFVTGLDRVDVINDDIQRLTVRAFGIMETLLTERDRIRRMDQAGMFSLDRHCPNLNNSTTSPTFNASVAVAFVGVGNHLSRTLDDLDRLVDENVVYARQGLTTISSLTTSINHTFEFIYDNDWIPKFFLMIMAIVNFFFLAGVILTRCNIIFFPLRFMLVWFLMPLFIVLLIVASVGAPTFGVMASANADFCAGRGVNASSINLSPKGTMEEIVLSHVASKSDVMYQAFDYYMNDCTTENPFDFVKAFVPQIRSTMTQAKDSLRVIDEVGIDQVSLVCGADITPLVDGLDQIAESLDVAQANIQLALDVSDCATITPIMYGIFYGAPCNEAVTGLSWMFGSGMAITILGLIMVTLRAALYNATIRGRKRTREEETRREFKEYQQYMSQFYEDAHCWKVQGSPLKAKEEGGILGIAASFETGGTSPSSDDASHDSDDSSVYLDYYGNADDDSDADSDDGSSHSEFMTPRKPAVAPRPSFVEEVMVSEKIRHLTHILDQELQPLSPPPTVCQAPKKPRKTLQRTSQRRTLA